MQEKVMQDFFRRFHEEVRITDLMLRMDRTPKTNNGVQLSYNCLFHSDSTPSFYVNQERNIFRCFGCGDSGGGPYKLIKLYLAFENRPNTPQSVVAFAGVDFQFPNFYVERGAELGKRQKFKDALAISKPAVLTGDKATVISKIMMGLTETSSDINLWEELFA